MKIVAMDFDGTLCTEKFPNIGEPIEEMIQLCKDIKKQGYKLILWTCREGQVLKDAVEWCKEKGIEFDAINDNIPEIKEEWNANVRKVYCDIYIDDKALNHLHGGLSIERVTTICENSTRSKGTISELQSN